MLRISGSRLLVALLLSAAAIGCGGNSSPTAPSATPTPAPLSATTIPIDGAFGTLRFTGSAVRKEYANSYDYVVQLTATLDAHATLNATTAIHLTYLLFEVSSSSSTNVLGDLFGERRSLSVDFTADGDTRQLPEMTFTVSKAAVTQAQHINMIVASDSYVWFVPGNLKVP